SGLRSGHFRSVHVMKPFTSFRKILSSITYSKTHPESPVQVPSHRLSTSSRLHRSITAASSAAEGDFPGGGAGDGAGVGRGGCWKRTISVTASAAAASDPPRNHGHLAG